jgi:hypothetical protein
VSQFGWLFMLQEGCRRSENRSGSLQRRYQADDELGRRRSKIIFLGGFETVLPAWIRAEILGSQLFFGQGPGYIWPRQGNGSLSIRT